MKGWMRIRIADKNRERTGKVRVYDSGVHNK